MVGLADKTFVISLLFAALLLVAACGQESVICNKPYILKGTACCLDTNNNSICDADEGNAPGTNAAACPVLDCASCPAQIVERNVTVTQFVCEKDGTVVKNKEDCNAVPPNPFANYTLVTQTNTTILNFTVRPACRDSVNGVEIHFITGSSSPEIQFEVKEQPGGSYHTIYVDTNGVTDEYLYGVFCLSNNCAVNKNFILDPDTVYVLRARFNYKDFFGEYQYSDEKLIDARSTGEFMTKLCS